jgi:hypothetical protein
MRPAPLLEWIAPPPQFSTPDMHRREDHQTSVDAAERVAPGRQRLQDEVHAVLIKFGPMTAGELEVLPQFSHYGPSTVRKRVSELFKEHHRIVDTGIVRDRMKVWRAV